jgi:CO/xanthine dehydrogenase Mo-binding subunit
MDPSGRATVLVGINSYGQGPRDDACADRGRPLGLGVEDVRVVLGDTDTGPYGSFFAPKATMAIHPTS